MKAALDAAKKALGWFGDAASDAGDVIVDFIDEIGDAASGVGDTASDVVDDSKISLDYRQW